MAHTTHSVEASRFALMSIRVLLAMRHQRASRSRRSRASHVPQREPSALPVVPCGQVAGR